MCKYQKVAKVSLLNRFSLFTLVLSLTVETVNVISPNGVDGMSLQKQSCLLAFFSAPLGTFREQEERWLAGWYRGCAMII